LAAAAQHLDDRIERGARITGTITYSDGIPAGKPFSSVQAGIHFVASKLAKSKLYKDKNVDQKLSTYNPQPEYAHPRQKRSCER